MNVDEIGSYLNNYEQRANLQQECFELDEAENRYDFSFN